jgi:OTU domain-containing protein 6
VIGRAKLTGARQHGSVDLSHKLLLKTMAAEETQEQMRRRHEEEVAQLEVKITNKKRNAPKKSRKQVDFDCEALRSQLREQHDAERARIDGDEPQKQNGDDPAQNLAGASGKEAGVEGLTAGLETTTLSLSAPAAADPSNSAPGKKRNRQKERLARRAAEQTAAAEQAADEAAGMVDHRSAEGSVMRAKFDAEGLEEVEIAPDGHCLFAAVADQLSRRGVALGSTRGAGKVDVVGERAGYRVVRAAAAGYMAAHRERFEPFLEEGFDEYVAKMRDGAEWGGQAELAALAGAYGVEIRVVQDGPTAVIVPDEGEPGGKGKEMEPAWLAYYRHGYGLGEHYNSLKKREKGKGPKEGPD